jgi:hypothetical protein
MLAISKYMKFGEEEIRDFYQADTISFRSEASRHKKTGA